MAVNIVNVGYDSTNYYIVATATGAYVLVDCGWPGTQSKLRGQLSRKGIELGKVKYLIVTHFHPDHAGLAQELRNLGTSLLLLETQVPYVAQMKTYMKPNSGYVEIVTEGCLVLRPEESRSFLKQIGIEGEIIPTPGHSPDSVSLILDEGIAFTGDLTPESILSTDDVLCRESWANIYGHGVQMVYSGHGGTP